MAPPTLPIRRVKTTVFSVATQVRHRADAKAAVELIALMTESDSCFPLSSRSLKHITDETLLLELARRGYDFSNFDANDETTAEIIKIG